MILIPDTVLKVPAVSLPDDKPEFVSESLPAPEQRPSSIMRLLIDMLGYNDPSRST